MMMMNAFAYITQPVAYNSMHTSAAYTFMSAHVYMCIPLHTMYTVAHHIYRYIAYTTE